MEKISAIDVKNMMAVFPFDVTSLFSRNKSRKKFVFQKPFQTLITYNVVYKIIRVNEL